MSAASVAAIILAAGASTRLGQPKQLVFLNGETFLERAIRAAVEADLTPVQIVLGASADAIGAQLRNRLPAQAHVLVNAEWQEGMASSIRAGILSLWEEQVDGAVLMACDQPAVSAGHLRALTVRAPEECTASAYSGRNGVPAYVPAHRFADLLALRGDEGARRLLKDSAAIELPNGELDVDTPEALALVRERFQCA